MAERLTAHQATQAEQISDLARALASTQEKVAALERVIGSRGDSTSLSDISEDKAKLEVLSLGMEPQTWKEEEAALRILLSMRSTASRATFPAIRVADIDVRHPNYVGGGVGTRIGPNIELASRENGVAAQMLQGVTGISLDDIQQHGLFGGENSVLRRMPVLADLCAYPDDKGIEKVGQKLGDDVAAFNLLRKAAETGETVAMANLRGCRLAADANSSSAMISLGRLYENGDGVPRNIGEARNWYTKAANLGDQEAKRDLIRLGD